MTKIFNLLYDIIHKPGTPLELLSLELLKDAYYGVQNPRLRNEIAYILYPIACEEIFKLQMTEQIADDEYIGEELD